MNSLAFSSHSLLGEIVDVRKVLVTGWQLFLHLYLSQLIEPLPIVDLYLITIIVANHQTRLFLFACRLKHQRLLLSRLKLRQWVFLFKAFALQLAWNVVSNFDEHRDIAIIFHIYLSFLLPEHHLSVWPFLGLPIGRRPRQKLIPQLLFSLRGNFLARKN